MEVTINYNGQAVTVEVSEEVWEAMRQAEREMNNYDRRKVYHRAYYSLDAYSLTEALARTTPHTEPLL